MPVFPTLEAIRDGQIVESDVFDFKAALDLDNGQGKLRFVNDVVAFLNRGAGYLIVGVREREGKCSGFQAVTEDRDALNRRLSSIIQDNIEPRPLEVRIEFIDVEGGFLPVIVIPEHRRRPYQNKINGSFYLRTGAQNTPLSRDEIKVMFKSEEEYEHELRRLSERENERLARRNVMRSDGPTFHLAALPGEYFDCNAAPYSRGRGVIRTLPMFSNGSEVPHACDDGYEGLAKDFDGAVITRVFLTTDWFLHAHVVHPFGSDASGRVTIWEFKKDLTRFLGAIERFFTESDIRGPFCMDMGVRNLRRSPKIAWCFLADAVDISRPRLMDRVADAEFIDGFHKRLIDTSRYG